MPDSHRQKVRYSSNVDSMQQGGSMPEFVKPVRDQTTIDAEHLRLLAIFHFVSAGFALLGLLFIAGHFALFHTLFDNPKLWADSKQGPPPQEFFTIFKWVYGVFTVWFLGSGIANVVSGFFLRARKHRTFSLVVAGFNCLHMPLGTILGVFTFIVLLRESVRASYSSE